MNELMIRYLKMQLRYIDSLPDSGELFFHNAHGAMEWEAFRQTDPKVAHEILDEWEEVWKPHFIEKIWGE
jgi:hypothetical protein